MRLLIKASIQQRVKHYALFSSVDAVVWLEVVNTVGRNELLWRSIDTSLTTTLNVGVYNVILLLSQQAAVMLCI